MLLKVFIKLALLGSLTNLLPQQLVAAATTLLRVRYPSYTVAPDPRTEYDRAIVDLMLQKTVAKYGPYELVASERMPQSRALASLKENQLVDVVPVTTFIAA
ncbi:MAG: hypothetical protein EOP07_17270 [Proteobacteria bacterium]|nr:MAG: hypothetical protein EOP07_17270 [Pseudomonadota bacterium]